VNKQDSIEIILYCIIRAIHRIAAPEAMILIVKAATQELVNYLLSQGVIDYLENSYKNIKNILKTLEEYDLISNIEISKNNNIIKITGNCKLAKLCKCVDKVIEKRQDLKSTFKERPCAIAMLLESYMEDRGDEHEVRVRCREGTFDIEVMGS